MKTSQRGIDLIKKFEGCRLTSYKDAVGVWTIGYGHTAGVKSGDKITEEEAEYLLKHDLDIYEEKVNKYSKYGWNQNQFDALVSFAYNIGSIDQLTSNGRRSINTISSKILEYNKAGGKKLEGLVRRRKAEKELFDEPVETFNEECVSEVKEEPQELYTASVPVASSEAKESQEKAQGEYIVGRTYTVTVNKALNVRKGPGKNYDLVGYANLTADGKKHAYMSGALKNGTKVTVQSVKINNDSVWLKIPSGWICAIDGSKTLVK